MPTFKTCRKYISLLLAVLTTTLGFQSLSAQAAMVSSGQMLASITETAQRDDVLQLLAQEEAQNAMTKLGVDPAMVEARVNRMTTDELTAFNEQVESMQAGGSVVGAVVLVFFVLIILDLLGTTNIFPAIKPVNTN